MPDNYFARYIPLLIHFVLVSIIAGAMVTLSWFIGQHKKNQAKMSPYECGMQPVGDVRGRFSVKFYLVAMLFILFDIEVVFLYPWAVVYRELLASHAGLILGAMLSFLGILLVGYLYAVRKRAFDWKD